MVVVLLHLSLGSFSGFNAGGKSTSTADGDDSLIAAQRPKSSIPTFAEIKQRVNQQMAVNPDWDPNTELPHDSAADLSTDVAREPIHSSWVYDSKPNTPATR